MKDYKDLEFLGPHEALRQLASSLEGRLRDGWTRNAEWEARLSKDPDDPMFVFACEKGTGHPAAGLCLAFRQKDELYVSNIVPKGAGRLSFDEYNTIVDEFAASAREVADELQLQTLRSDGIWKIEDYVTPATLEKLALFAATANRSTGTAHPNDEKRWFDFVVSCHEENSRLGPTDLQRWLEEGEDWPEAEARDLILQYEKARALLAFYDLKK